MGRKRRTSNRSSKKVGKVMEALLEFLIKQITGKKPSSIKRAESDGFVNFVVTVPKVHMAILIGKSGRMIQAIRTLARVRGAQENIKVNIELVESSQSLKETKLQEA